MNSIQVIDVYFCKKEDEISHIKHIKSIDEFDKYKKNIIKNNNNEPVLMEYYTGDQNLKPFFDVENYIASNSSKKEIKDSIELLNTKCVFELGKMYPNKNIIELMRPYRLVNKDKIQKIKISFRFIINNVVTNCMQIKESLKYYFKNDPITLSLFDLSVYRNGSNRICMEGGVKPYDEKIDLEKMKPFKIYNSSDTHSIFDMSITYIDKDYEKYVCKIPAGPIEEDINESIKIVEINEGNDDIINEENVEDYKIIKSYINNLNKNRSKHYNDWLEILMIITNIGQSSNWTNSQILELSHEFSKTSPGFYDYKSVDKKIKIYVLMIQNVNIKLGKKNYY